MHLSKNHVLHKNTLTTLFFLFTFISASSEAVASEPIEKTAVIIEKLNRHFTEMASKKKIGTMPLDSMDAYFQTIIKKIPAIKNVMRINSNGVVINDISSESAESKMRNVSDQKWFTQVKDSKQPYYGISRDSSGNAMMFWAWPIIYEDSTFSGIITAKLQPSVVLQMAAISTGAAIKMLLNDNAIYKNSWADTKTFSSDTIRLSSQSFLVLQAQENNGTNDVAQDTGAAVVTTSSSSGNNENSLQKTESTKPVSSPASGPTVYTSDFGNEKEKKSSKLPIIIFLLISSILFIITVMIIKKRVQKIVLPPRTDILPITQLPLSNEKSPLSLSKALSVTDSEETLAIVPDKAPDAVLASSDAGVMDETLIVPAEHIGNEISIVPEGKPSNTDEKVSDDTHSIVSTKVSDDTQSHLLETVIIPQSKMKDAIIEAKKAIEQEEMEKARLQSKEAELVKDADDSTTPETKDKKGPGGSRSKESDAPDYEEETKEIGLPHIIQHAKRMESKAAAHNSLPNKAGSNREMRMEIYREIHSQILQWVICETTRLNSKIDDLNERLSKIDAKEKDALKEIHNEAEQIQKEIDLFKNHFSDGNS